MHLFGPAQLSGQGDPHMRLDRERAEKVAEARRRREERERPVADGRAPLRRQHQPLAGDVDDRLVGEQEVSHRGSRRRPAPTASRPAGVRVEIHHAASGDGVRRPAETHRPAARHRGRRHDRARRPAVVLERAPPLEADRSAATESTITPATVETTKRAGRLSTVTATTYASQSSSTSSARAGPRRRHDTAEAEPARAEVHHDRSLAQPPDAEHPVDRWVLRHVEDLEPHVRCGVRTDPQGLRRCPSSGPSAQPATAVMP